MFSHTLSHAVKEAPLVSNAMLEVLFYPQPLQTLYKAFTYYSIFLNI